MLFLDTEHKEMMDMNISEKVRLNFAAMKVAKIFTTSKFMLLAVFFTLLSIVVATIGWMKTGHISTSLCGILFVFFVGYLTVNKLFKSDYRSCMNEVLHNKEAILGNEQQRIENNKNRAVHLIMLSIFLPLAMIAIFIYI